MLCILITLLFNIETELVVVVVAQSVRDWAEKWRALSSSKRY